MVLHSCSAVGIRYYVPYHLLSPTYNVPVRPCMSITQQQAPFQLRRIGTIMEPDPADPREAWGVLNPASARKDGDLYLFPRIVAEGNYSRIGIARVNFNAAGDPVGVVRLGFALEPEEEYERSERATGGVEDARVTYVE